MTHPHVTARTLALHLSLWLLTGTAMACNVPVFRYALERWDADIYYALVVHGPGGLSDAEQAAYDLLKRYSISEYGVINLEVYQFNRNALAQSQFGSLFPESSSSSDGAAIYLLHPLSAEKTGPIWQAPLTEASVSRLLADPDRLALLKKITSGTSVVMLMLESGNPELDDAAWQRLNKAIALTREFLALPEGIELHDGTITGDGSIPADPVDRLMSSIPLKLDFDLQRLARNAANGVLVNSLLSIDSKLSELTAQPMVFPVFGRARFIYPMVGDEISEDNILFVSQYVCGACSCEIKAQNPGMELPVLMDWEAVLYGGEQVVDMEQFLATEALVHNDPGAGSAQKGIRLTNRSITIALLIGGAFVLGGIILFLRSRLS